MYTRRHALDSWSAKDLMLVFSGSGCDITDYDDLLRLMRAPFVRRLFEGFYIGFYIGVGLRWIPHDWSHWVEKRLPPQLGFVISASWAFSRLGEAPLNAAVCVHSDGVYHQRTTQDIVDNCRRLQRLMGCTPCELNGDECFREHIRLPNKQPTLNRDVDDDFQDLNTAQWLEERQLHTPQWRDVVPADVREDPYWDTTVAGYTLIPPSIAGPNAVAPSTHAYALEQLDFRREHLTTGLDALSDRSSAAGKTRSTKMKECSRCCFGGTSRYAKTIHSCKPWGPRVCAHGAWTEEQVIDQTLKTFEELLTASGFTLRDFECLLAVAGKTLYVPYGPSETPHKFVIRGFGFDEFAPSAITSASPRVTVRLLRVAAADRGTVKDYLSVEQFLKHVKPALRQRYANAPSLDRETLALAAQAVCLRAIESYTCTAGCFRSVQPRVSHVRAYPSGSVEIGYWVRSYWRDRTVDSLKDLVDRFYTLPMFPLLEEEGLARYNHWPH